MGALRKNPGVWATILSSIAAISSFAVQVKEIRAAVPVPALLIWLTILSVSLSSIVWILATSPRSSQVIETSQKPTRRIKVAALTSVLTAVILGMLARAAAIELYPRIELKELEIPAMSEDQLTAAKATTLKELFEKLNSGILQAAQTSADRLVFVSGPAGSGKSFLVRVIQERFKPQTQVIHLCHKVPRTHLCQNLDGIEYMEKAELTFGPDAKNRFNVMSFIKSFSAAAFFASFKAGSIVLVDDLDEVHPESAAFLLGEIAKFEKTSGSGASAVVFGRPESFASFFTSAETNDFVPDATVFSLKVPSYQTQHEVDLLVDDWGHYEKTVDAATIGKISAALYSYSQHYPWVRQSLRDIYLGNFLCERFGEKQVWKEEELKKELVGRMFLRAHETHGRPQYQDTMYKQLIIKTAADRARHVIVDTGNLYGFFPVGDESVEIDDSHGGKWEVHERDLLSLSGLAVLSPLNWESQRWQFSPSWVHGYFVEQYNETQRPHYWVAYLVVPLIVLPLGPLITLAVCV